MPAVHRIDHVNIITDAPGPLATKLSEALGLPFSSTLVSLPPFDFAILAAGNVTIEVLRFGSRRRIPAVPTHAELGAIVFDTEDLDATLAELRGAEIPHLAPLVFSGEPTRLPAYDEFRRSPNDPNWRVTIIDGVLTDKLVSKRVSARPVAGSSPRAVRTARAMGRLAGSARLGRLAAPMFDPGPQFLAVCEWGHDRSGSRAADERRVAESATSGLGIRRMREVVVEATDLAAARLRWQRLLGPPEDGEDCWKLGDGPSLRLTEGFADRVGAIVLESQLPASALEQPAAGDLCGLDIRVRTDRLGPLALDSVSVNWSRSS